MKSISRIKQVLERSPDKFRGRYKGYDIDIERDYEADEDGNKFYIHVRNPSISFGTAYDGWWDGSGLTPCRYPTIEDAVHQALIGSYLIETPPTNGGGDE